MKKLLFLLLAATLFSPDICAVGAYYKGDTLNVFALSGLRLRGARGGAIVAVIPYGSKIAMLEGQPADRRDTVENIPGHWAKTVWQGIEGYVFDGFLSILPAPDTAVKNIGSYCQRYFEARGAVSLQDSERFSEGLQFYRYFWAGWCFYIEVNKAEGRGEMYNVAEKMTFRNSREKIAAEELYLLMCAIFREKIEAGKEMIAAGKVKTAFLNDEEITADKDFFRFVPNTKSGNYAAFNGYWEELEYSLSDCGASVGWGYAD